MTKFSIFLPVRNGWPYVQECVESILQQTYPHFELNILDNQSSDNTLPWLQSLTDSRIILWTSNEPLSIVDSWLRIKELDKREYMTLIGHDDSFAPGFLAAIKELIDFYPNAALYYTGSRLINSDGKKIRSCYGVPARETSAQYLAARFTFNRDIFGAGYVMRSEDYDRVGGIPSFEKLFFADDALWLSLLRNSYMVTDPVEYFSVRIHSKSESASVASTWPSIMLGLNQFTEFLQRYIENDAEMQAVMDELGPEFLLVYYRNCYIYALVEACQLGRKIEPEVLRTLESSLLVSAPSVVREIRNSLKVIIIERLNASPFRGLVPALWDIYYKLKTKTQ